MAAIHIDFTPLGFEGQWADLIDIGAKSPAQFAAVIALKDEETEESARAFFAAVIVAWNVVDPATSEPLGPPSSTGWTVGQIPMRITKAIAENINAQVEDVRPKVGRG